MIGPHLHARPAVTTDREGSVRDVAQSAHAQLCEHQPRLESTGHVDAGVDDAGSGRERVNPDAKVVRARDISIGERPRPLVHPELTHSFLPTHTKTTKDAKITKTQPKEHEDCETARIFIFFVIFVFVFFETFVIFVIPEGMMTRLACALLLVGAALLTIEAQTPATGTGPVLFEGARLITGDGRAAIENSAFLVEGARITQVGTRGSVRRPAGVTSCRSPGQDGDAGARRCPQSSRLHRRANRRHRPRLTTRARTCSIISAGTPTTGSPPRSAWASIVASFHTSCARRRPTARRSFSRPGRGIAMPNAGPNALYWRDAPYGVTTENDGAAGGSRAGSEESRHRQDLG